MLQYLLLKKLKHSTSQGQYKILENLTTGLILDLEDQEKKRANKEKCVELKRYT